MKLTYHWEGDYLIPDLVAQDSPQIGIWGERRRQFLRKHQKPLYDAMLMKGRSMRTWKKSTAMQEKCSIDLWIKWPKKKTLQRR